MSEPNQMDEIQGILNKLVQVFDLPRGTKIELSSSMFDRRIATITARVGTKGTAAGIIVDTVYRLPNPENAGEIYE